MIDTQTDTFHMVQLYLDPRRLVQLGKMQGLPLARTDTNYLVHCALGELFGDDAPKPFFVDDDPRTVEETAEYHDDRHVRVLGYADADDDMLQQEAKLSPNPTIGNLYDKDRLDSHEMLSSFRKGRRLQFELRACPVIRKASAGEGVNQNGETRTWDEGDELDAFLAKAWSQPEKDLNREKVYRKWLSDQFDHRGGATSDPDQIAMTRFSIERMTRRTHGADRSVETIKRPDVTLTGTLQVTDSDAFVNLLRSGLGRHKSFGYGMLKVRRA
ncbi:type I-E CRISPR-associated protein Cas6/Cse3/CasE [Salinibacter altiplanensis]|uniref:type I-E CRISPR-associated protein Cas6/Cse3/CasE n=1 Tax=Salinibacter altiplanensis TaxID=1803181 RepID=UPI000C9F38FD|nr:type I-E CRISPR-associated protein Cas6/Cse3/CasE [Salinibacter altiplanensis]